MAVTAVLVMGQMTGGTFRRRMLGGVVAGLLMAGAGAPWAADKREVREFGCGEDLMLAYSEISRDLDRNPNDYALQALAGLVQEMRGFPSAAREHYAKVKAPAVQDRVSIECGPVKIREATPSQIVAARLKQLDGGKGGKTAPAADAGSRPDSSAAAPAVPPAEKRSPPPEEKVQANLASPKPVSPSAKEVPVPTAAKTEAMDEKAPPAEEQLAAATAGPTSLPTVNADEEASPKRGSPAEAPAEAQPRKPEEKSATIFDFWKSSEEPEAKPKEEEKPFFQLWEPPKPMPRVSEVGAKPGAAAAPPPAAGAPAEPPAAAAKVAPAQPESVAEEPAPAPPARKPASKSGPPVAYLGTYSTEARARDALKAFNGKFAKLMAGHEGYVQTLDRGERGMAYRVGVRGFTGGEAVNKFCGELKKQTQECVAGQP